MNFRQVLILLLILVGIVFISSTAESFISSGALVQLAAKGPQDWYLTGWPRGHGYYGYPYGGFGIGYPYNYGYPNWYGRGWGDLYNGYANAFYHTY